MYKEMNFGYLIICIIILQVTLTIFVCDLIYNLIFSYEINKKSFQYKLFKSINIVSIPLENIKSVKISKLCIKTIFNQLFYLRLPQKILTKKYLIIDAKLLNLDFSIIISPSQPEVFLQSLLKEIDTYKNNDSNPSMSI